MKDLIDSEGFRANVGIILTRPASAGGPQAESLFLGGRPAGRGWQFPQGGVREGESAEAALYRELTEEIGLEAGDVDLLGSTRDWLHYRLPTHYRRRTLPLCVGQKQRWFLLRLRSDEARIRFDTTDTPEFDRWKWVPYWEPVKEVIYFKRRVYSRALHELGPLIFPHGLPPYPQDWPDDLLPRTASRRRRRGPRRRS